MPEDMAIESTDPSPTEEVDNPEDRFLTTLAQHMFTAISDSHATEQEKKLSSDFIKDSIVKRKMVNVYQWVTANSSLALDLSQEEVDRMSAENEKALEEFDSKIKDAETNLGDIEVQSAMLARADYLKNIGDLARGVAQYRITEGKTVGVGPKLDIVLSVLQLAIFWDDVDLTRTQLEKAKQLLDEGGDWERRNRLKVYESVYLMRIRDFSQAALLLQESIATFTCTELMSYNRFIFYTVVLSLVSCDRPTLKEKVVHAPEILQVIQEMPELLTLMKSLHECRYSDFFPALLKVNNDICSDRYLTHHGAHYLREMRIKLYAQFLDPYKSVSMTSMAQSFGVSVPFLDTELSRFIASGRLACKIDKVKQLVEAQRPDSRNAMYHHVMKQGDVLLNRVQKLSRVINA